MRAPRPVLAERETLNGVVYVRNGIALAEAIPIRRNRPTSQFNIAMVKKAKWLAGRGGVSDTNNIAKGRSPC